MSISVIFLSVVGVAGCGMLIVGAVLVVWAVMQDRKSSH